MAQRARTRTGTRVSRKREVEVAAKHWAAPWAVAFERRAVCMNDELHQMNDEVRAQQEAAWADYRHRVRVWAGGRGARARWGAERSRVRRVKLYQGDADALVRLAKERGCTVADVVRTLLGVLPA